eukprot:6482897-Prymnesium_polylepis.1
MRFGGGACLRPVKEGVDAERWARVEKVVEHVRLHQQEADGVDETLCAPKRAGRGRHGGGQWRRRCGRLRRRCGQWRRGGARAPWRRGLRRARVPRTRRAPGQP